MKINRKIRLQYNLDDALFDYLGNIKFGGDIHLVRDFVQRVNQKKDLINFPETAVYAGYINGASLIFEIYDHFIDRYKKEISQQNLNQDLFDYLIKKLGEEKLNDAIRTLLEEFPSQPVFSNEIDIKEFLKEKTNDTENKYLLLDELISLWLANGNPSFTPYLEFFNDEVIEKTTHYHQIMETIFEFFEETPPFGPKNQSLLEMLKEPAKEHPHSLQNQLEYILKNWSHLLDSLFYRILLAIDLIREEEKFRGLGAGESKVYEYDITEEENYTPDKDWMPKVVMIAKNIYVWLDQLSKKYNRTITKLHDVPEEELEILRDRGFNALWLIGVWDRSQASKTIKRWCGNPEAEASAYSIYDYVISPDLGGYDSFINLKERAWKRGIRMASDMVPNHMGIVSKWTIDHPDWFISLPYPPFPSYNYSGDNLSGNPDLGIYLEDKYFTRSDAAVTFKHVEFHSGITRYLYHGNDGTHLPWNDTAQLNYLLPQVREAVIQKIVEISKMFSIIRFDAAMVLTRKHYQRLWFPEPGSGGAIPSRAEHGISKEDFFKAMPNEFWREVVERINQENPDTLLLAEAFWLLEGFFVRTLGMHRVYNSAFMNMLRDEDNAKYRTVMKNTLEFDPKILKRFVNFMNNPDEETAIKQFGTGDKYFGICTMLVTMPGLPMFGHGQIEGFEEKYGMEYRRAYREEEIDWGLVHYHENTIFPLMKKRYLFAEVKNFVLYDFWEGNHVNEDVFAYSNRMNQEKALIIYHNKYSETKGYIKSSVSFKEIDEEEELIQITLAEAFSLPQDNYCFFRDKLTGLEYIRRNKDLHEKGLYIELSAYKVFMFLDFQIIIDNQFFHYAQLYEALGGRGVPNIQDALQEIIYKPLHASLKELMNKQMYLRLLNVDKFEEIKIDITSKLEQYLLELEGYSNQKVLKAELKEEIIEKLKIILKLKDLIQKIPIFQDYKPFILSILPENTFDTSILITWCLVHNLGKIVSKENHEAKSRSWIDEWQLTKLMRTVLKNITSEKKEKIWEAVLLIKLMVTYQNWFLKIKFDNINPSILLTNLLSDPEIQEFLKVNRYQEKLWFNAEAFQSLIKWFVLLAQINFIQLNESELDQRFGNFIKIMQFWNSTAPKSNYQVKNLIELVK